MRRSGVPAARCGARVRGRARRRQDHVHPGHRPRPRRRRARHQPDLRPGSPVSRAARAGVPSGLLPAPVPDEAGDLDWEGLIAEGDAILVEWPERAGAWLPEPARRFRLHHLPDPPGAGSRRCDAARDRDRHRSRVGGDRHRRGGRGRARDRRGPAARRGAPAGDRAPARATPASDSAASRASRERRARQLHRPSGRRRSGQGAGAGP